MVSVSEALNRILEAVSPMGLEKVNILDALGRVVAEDIYAGRAIPPKDHSTMDGYALRAVDTFGASPGKPIFLDVVEDIPAGSIPVKRIEQGQAARIMTGGPLPEGADSVLRMEDTRREEARVALLVEVKKGQKIRRAGEDVQQGERVISRGEIIRPAEVGMLASLGRSFILVHQRPLIAIVATGNELLDIDEPLTPWKIVGSNSYSLAALVTQCGGIPLQTGIAQDRREDLIAKFQAATRADLILSSGGVSLGDYDLVKEIMQEKGNCMHFWQIAMKPGRQLAFGSLGNVPIVGLPGNPVSTMVCFELFIRPAILKMLGHKNLFRRVVQAHLNKDIKKEKGSRHFIRAQVRWNGEEYEIVTTGRHASGILKSMVHSNGLIIVPEDATIIKADETVAVQLLDDSLGYSPEPGY